MADQNTQASSLRQSPLEAMAHRFLVYSDLDPVRLEERAFETQIGLRGNASRKGFRDAVKKATGTDLPTEACTVSTVGEVSILWLGPDEWLVVAPDARELALLDALQKTLAKQHAAVIDLSANRTVIELSGPSARAVLEKGCLHDLHPRAFPVGRVVGTIMARTQVFLEKTAEGPDVFRLYVRCSFARHLADWLLDAMVEFATEPGELGR
ncbi:MAG: sarcosine oxidase subunit gamma family protein [Pseudomonadota bacterium]